ncbi:hypothetical protein CWATWH0003_3694 [Crocosphaera watsonii WH 0003]|uniref:Uncharacterized protein n=1 Tax=Crocosphaera watsonii WH 0003 TaxID=423471 RepID=G5J8B2_CROWT|nr:hypothetical protein CWATWH0003_3694 [Crocosphaera watsonii WH 0003]
MWGDWEMGSVGRLGDGETGRLGDWEMGRLGRVIIDKKTPKNRGTYN